MRWDMFRGSQREEDKAVKPLRRISWAIVRAIALTIFGAGSIAAAPPDGKGKPKREVNSVQLAVRVR